VPDAFDDPGLPVADLVLFVARATGPRKAMAAAS